MTGTKPPHVPGSLTVAAEFTPPAAARQRDEAAESVTHVRLDSARARVSDLARAFGRHTFFIPSAEATLSYLRQSMRSRRRRYRKIRQTDESEEEDGDDEESDEEEDDEDSSEDGGGGEGVRVLTSSFNALHVVLNGAAQVIAPGECASELASRFIEHEYVGWGETLLRNARAVLENSNAGSETSRAIRAVLAKSMENQALFDHGIANPKAAAAARADYAALEGTGRLPRRKGKPRGKSHVSDDAVRNAVRSVLAGCSTTAWSMRTHVVAAESVRTSLSSSSEQLDDDEDEYLLPALHRLMSKAEMFEEHLRQFPNKADHLDRSSFYLVAARLSFTQARSLRALDYNITDLLHEPRARLKSVIMDLGSDEEEAGPLLKDLDLVYSAVQHLYPKLIGTTDNAQHNVRFGVGNGDAAVGSSGCSTVSAVVRFFEDRLPAAFGGKLGEHYGDIIHHSLEKVILYMGHALRCVAQQKRIEEVRSEAGVETVIVTMDYMMKYEESRARESSGQHYGKRGQVVHGAMVERGGVAAPSAF